MNRMMIMALCLVLTSVSCTTAVGENKTGEFVTSVKGGKKIKMLLWQNSLRLS